MTGYCLKVASHYSGMICAHFPDFPGLVVLGRDHDEATLLAAEVLDAELERRLREKQTIPPPRATGRLHVSTDRI